MTLAALMSRLSPTGVDDVAFPRHLLGAFRRKSISFCTGVTDETTIVYWFQSKSFTIDLRLHSGAETPLAERQGWIGDTIWDATARQLSWRVERSYQPRNQWPEPADLYFIGNSVLEFAPSGAYSEDWRQQSARGPLLGLRLTAMVEEATGQELPLEGGIVVAGEHVAIARSRRAGIDDALKAAGSLEEALAAGVASEAEIESYEVSVAIGGETVGHSTQPHRLGQPIVSGDFTIRADGTVAHKAVVGGVPCVLLYAVDVFAPDVVFGMQTPATADAADWMEQEKRHLFHHAVFVR